MKESEKIYKEETVNKFKEVSEIISKHGISIEEAKNRLNKIKRYKNFE